MDPRATLHMLKRALADMDFAAAEELLYQYREWRSAAGFEPMNVDGKRGDAVAASCARFLADYRAQE